MHFLNRQCHHIPLEWRSTCINYIATKILYYNNFQDDTVWHNGKPASYYEDSWFKFLLDFGLFWIWQAQSFSCGGIWSFRWMLLTCHCTQELKVHNIGRSSHLQAYGVPWTEFGNCCKSTQFQGHHNILLRCLSISLTLLFFFSFFAVPYLFPQHMTITFFLLPFHNKARNNLLPDIIIQYYTVTTQPIPPYQWLLVQ